jgi:hypothetical protein
LSDSPSSEGTEDREASLGIWRALLLTAFVVVVVAGAITFKVLTDGSNSADQATFPSTTRSTSHGVTTTTTTELTAQTVALPVSGGGQRCSVGLPLSGTTVIGKRVPFPGGQGVVIGMSNGERIGRAWVRTAQKAGMDWVNASVGEHDSGDWAANKDGVLDQMQRKAPHASAVIVILAHRATDTDAAAAQLYRKDLPVILGELQRRLPDLKVVYLQGRETGQFVIDPEHKNGEPYAYETNLINRDYAATDHGWPFTVVAGPYVWNDPTCPRADGFTLTREDFEADGLHPDKQGSAKVAEQMLAYFQGR